MCSQTLLGLIPAINLSFYVRSVLRIGKVERIAKLYPVLDSTLKMTNLNNGWLAARASEVSQSGEELTTAIPDPTVTGNCPWIQGVVPGTILTTMLHNGLIPDPLYGLNNEEIPDIGDVGREYYTFWFYNTFQLPHGLPSKGKAWLQFRAINYQAEIFVNGHQKLLSKGMFLRQTLDITNWLSKSGVNRLAVLVHPPDHPGKIPIVGGQGGDHDIGKDVAAQYVEGWDWIVGIRDRNTGIWDQVTVFTTGPVRLVDPHLVATFPTSAYTELAQLWVTMELVNTDSAPTTVTVTVTATLDKSSTGGAMVDSSVAQNFSETQTVTVDANATLLYSLPAISVAKPALWWPNGLGEQPLYKVDVSVQMGGCTSPSDSWSHMFGFRHIDSHIDPKINGRKFNVNGEPIFIRGGNYIVSDALLRLSQDRYNTEVGFHADMNLNMIRIWGGALAERPEFYNACDRHGILVWQEFWITGDCDGRGQPPSDANWPLDHELWLTCAYDTVKLLRNHASLALWCGGNEQHPADDLNTALTTALVIVSPESDNPSRALDGTRLYIEGSLWSGIAAGDGGFHDGPYTIQVPEKFFYDGYYPYAFNPEVGNVGVPKADTIRATMPPDAWAPPQSLYGEHPNATWFYHKFIQYADGQNLIPGQIETYGKYTTLDDFCEKAQLANYLQYRALIEGWNTWMWTRYTGVLIWKTQNPWPGLRGQMYDHLLDQTGAFFGLKCAAEPVHVQFNLSTYVVQVVNTKKDTLSNTTIEATVYDITGAIVHSTTWPSITFEAKTTTSVGSIPLFTAINKQPMYFLLLKLKNLAGVLVSRNFYWLHPTPGSYSQLAGYFRSTKIPVAISAHATISGNTYKIRVQVTNEKGSARYMGTTAIAFALQFSVIDKNSTATDTRILPVTYSDNWFSLVPDETAVINISFQVKKHTVSPKLMLRGWNVADTEVTFTVG